MHTCNLYGLRVKRKRCETMISPNITEAIDVYVLLNHLNHWGSCFVQDRNQSGCKNWHVFVQIYWFILKFSKRPVHGTYVYTKGVKSIAFQVPLSKPTSSHTAAEITRVYRKWTFLSIWTGHTAFEVVLVDMSNI